MNTANSTTVGRIDTHRVTLCEYEADVRYPLSTFPEPIGEPCSGSDVAIVLTLICMSSAFGLWMVYALCVVVHAFVVSL